MLRMTLFLALLILGGNMNAEANTPANCPDIAFLGYDFPSVQRDWTSDNVQGVAHDANNWFFTTTKYLLKFPVSFDLSTNANFLPKATRPPGVLVVPIPPALQQAGYVHCGDLEQVGGFLFVPVEFTANPGIAVFRAADLKYIGLKKTHQKFSPWVAFNPQDNMLYNSDETISSKKGLYRYKLDLNALRGKNPDVERAITFHDTVYLLEKDGSPLNRALGNYIQGGVFSPWGDLFIVNGRGAESVEAVRGGIHRFGPDRKLISESQNGSGCFNYEYHPNIGQAWEEPEGIDWWDRDVGIKSPGIKGQLHVILIDKLNHFYFKHYAVKAKPAAHRPATEAAASVSPEEASPHAFQAKLTVVGNDKTAVNQDGTAQYSGTCPSTINFQGTISAPKAGEVKYTFVRSDGGRMTARTLKFDKPGTKEVTTSWKLGKSLTGWVAIEIEAPKFRSNRSIFEVNCQ